MTRTPVPGPRGGVHDDLPEGPPELPAGWWSPTYREDDQQPAPGLSAAGDRIGRWAGHIVLAVTVVVAALLAWGVTADTHDRATPTYTPAPTPVATGATVPAADFTAWLTGGGAAMLDQLRADMAAISGAGSVPAMAGPCTNLGRHAAVAAGQPAPADPVARAEWTGALSSLRAAAGDCQRAARTGDRDQFDRAAAELDTATTHLAALNARVTAATRQK